MSRATDMIAKYRAQQAGTNTSASIQETQPTEKSRAQQIIDRYREQNGPKDTAQTRAAERTTQLESAAAQKKREAAARVVTKQAQTLPTAASFDGSLYKGTREDLDNHRQQVINRVERAEQVKRAAETPSSPLPTAQHFAGATKIATSRGDDYVKTAVAQANIDKLQQQKNDIMVKEAEAVSAGNYSPEYGQQLRELDGKIASARKAAGIPEPKKADWGKVALSTVVRGNDQALGALASSADFILGGATKLLLGLSDEEYKSLNTPTTAFKNWVKKQAAINDKYFANAAGDSRTAQVVGELGASTVAAIPQAVLAFFSAGSSLAAEATTAGVTAASAIAQGGLRTAVYEATKAMAKNPQYWLSFLNVAGENYEDAKADGAGELAATSYAISNGLLNALVEIGGEGIDTLPKNLQKGGKPLLEWVESAIDEGKEEVVQGLIEREFQNLVYGKNNPLISLTDENAVINPVTSAKEFGGGFFVGGLLGAGQVAANKAINAGLDSYYRKGSYTELGRAVRSAGEDGINGVIDAAKTMGEGAAAKLASRLESKIRNGNDITDEELGRLYIETAQEMQNAAPETGTAENTQGAARNEQNVPQNTQNVPRDMQNVPQNVPENARGVIQNARGVNENAENVIRNANNANGNVDTGERQARYPVLPTAEQEMEQRLRRNAETELERSGIAAGVSYDTIERVKGIARTFGRDIVFYSGGNTGENGYRDMKTGRIYINADSGNPVMQIIGHELTHSIEESDSYGKLAQLVKTRLRQQGQNVDELREAKKELYARRGVNLDDSGADAEVVAEYIEKNLLTDEQSIYALVRQDRTLGRKIMDFIDGILAKLGNKDAQERAFLTKARQYYAKALKESPRTEPERGTGTGTESDNYLADLREQLRSGAITDEEYDRLFDEYYRGGSEGQYSFGGERAKSADLDALQMAKKMRDEDIADDVILRETGWFVGADGKWRFEIDDSGMEFRKDGDARLMQEPGYKRLDELTEKWAASMEGDGTPLTSAEEAEMERLQEEYSDRVWDEKYLLSDFLRHDKLFEQYPMLKYMTLSFEKLDAGRRGYYDRQNGRIVLDSAMLGGEKDTLIHEIQHVIQKTEGFSGGASPEYWARREYESGDLVTERLQREYDKLLNSLPKEEQNKYIRYTELDRELERLFLSDENSEDGRRYTRLEEKQDTLYEELYPNKWFRDLLDLDRRMNDAPGEYLRMYRNTAGEIEARDAASRKDLTANERRERMPDRGDENTVFAEGASNSFSIRRTEDIPYQEQIDAFYSGDEKALGRSDDVFISERNAGLKKLGLGSNPFFMLKRNLKKIIRTEGRNPKYSAHGLSEDIVRRLPDIINSPALVVTGNGRVSVISDVKVETPKSKAAPLLIGIDPNSSVDGRSAYEVKSVYGKDDFANWLKLRAGDSTILAGNENKAKALLRDVGIQITEPVAYADDLTNEILSHDAKDVNGQFSISERTPEQKREIFRNLQAYMNGSIDTRELKRYVSSLDDSIDYSTEEDSLGVRSARLKTAAEEEAERIVRAAHGEGVGVEEYLRRNWDEYESDGQLNEEARKAIELERRQLRRYSQSETDGQTAPDAQSEAQNSEETQEPQTTQTDAKPRDIRSTMPVKARDYLKRTERNLIRRIGDAMRVPKFAQREYLSDIAREISDEYLRDGRVSEETAERLFNRAYKEGVVQDEEYYNQYKDLKDFLRTRAVTISGQDKADIADFSSFRKSAFGTLRIVNEGGEGVDTTYEELRNMAPELFPANITHPADQLVRMYEVARSIQRTEKSLDDYYGYDAEEFKKWAKGDFDTAIGDTLGELRNIKRFTEERAQEAKPISLATTDEVKEAYKQLKDARKAYEKAEAKNLLTQDDEIQVGRLMRGETTLDYIDPKKNNYRGIKAVYEAKQEYEKYAKTIRDWNDSRRAELRDKADSYLKTANSWKDKKRGALYSRETMERNIYDIIKDEKLAKSVIDEYFTPVHTSQAESTRLKNRMRDRVRKLNLSTTETKAMQREGKVSEAHAVQLIGEAMDNIRMLENSRGRMKERDGKTLNDWRGIVQSLWADNPQLDRAKIENAVEEFRSIYDELFEMMNETRLRNGYEPVNYRKGYFPHFQPGDGDGIMGMFGKALGIETQVTALPTTINGLTHTFRPGIQWFSGALERRGFETAYNAVEGFDRYIEGVADVIYQTDNIQKLRALATQARYRTGDEGIKKQVDAVRADTTLSEEDKQNRIDQIYKDGHFALSNFVVELEEYTNLLANKKSRHDRSIEQMLGRDIYNLSKALESRVAANMVAVNVGSWLTNYIPLTQGWAQLSTKDLLRGMWQTLKDMKVSDGIIDASTFLTNRKGSDPLVRTWAQKASATLSSPMEHIDQFTAGSLIRARYNQNLRRGLSQNEAMSEADSWVAGVMADRSKGSTPTLFNRANPVTKLFTQFQLEVNNQLGYLFKDMPREQLKKGIGALALSIFKFCLGAWLFDEVYEYFIGRRAALDPIGILNDTVGDITGYELPNLVELGVGAVTGNMPSFKTEKAGVGGALKNLGENVAGELPFTPLLSLVGLDIDGGRVPVSSAIPNVGNLYKAATEEGWSTKKKLATARKELSKPATYLVPPFGGGQLKKIYQGLEAVARGGSYTVDSEGNEQLQYPVFTDTPLDTAKSVVQSTLFGKTALPGGKEWIDSGFKSFSAKQTAAYQGMLDAGVSQKDAYSFLKGFREIKKTDEESEAALKREHLENSSISGEGKSVVYYGLMASDTEKAAMDELADAGADMGEVTKVMLGMKEAGDKSADKLKVISGAKLDNSEMLTLAGIVMGTDLTTDSGEMTQYAKLRACVDAGMKASDALAAKADGTDLEKLLEFHDSGLDFSAARRVADEIAKLEPQEGKKSVSDAQKWRAAVDSAKTGEEERAALKTVMGETTYKKYEVALSQGVETESFVHLKEILPQFDASGNGSYSNEELEAAIDSMGGGLTSGNGRISTAQQAVLWQVFTTSKSAKNNPYSKKIGQKVLDALNG